MGNTDDFVLDLICSSPPRYPLAPFGGPWVSHWPRRGPAAKGGPPTLWRQPEAALSIGGCEGDGGRGAAKAARTAKANKRLPSTPSLPYPLRQQPYVRTWAINPNSMWSPNIAHIPQYSGGICHINISWGGSTSTQTPHNMSDWRPPYLGYLPVYPPKRIRKINPRRSLCVSHLCCK